MFVHVARHLVAASVADVLFLERFVPDRGVAAKRSTEGGVEGHQVVDLVGERVDLGVVDLVRVELIRPLAFLWMPVLMENSSAAQPSHLAVVGEAPRKRREIPVVAPEPVAAELPRPIREDVDHLQVVESHGKS